MSRYVFTDDMREISGFGGGYEACCRAMVVAGLEWLDAHPDAKPEFGRYASEGNDHAKALGDAILKPGESGGGATGAMFGAAVSHVLRVRKVGWDAYCAEMRELKKKEVQKN